MGTVGKEALFWEPTVKKSLETNRGTGGECTRVKKGGVRCRARRMENSKFCFFHSPATKQERQSAQRAGGLKNRPLALPSSVPDVPLDNMRDVVRLLADTVNRVRRGELDPKVANSVGYLAGILMKGLERSDIEARLETLEAAVKPRGSRPEYSFEKSPEE